MLGENVMSGYDPYWISSPSLSKSERSNFAGKPCGKTMMSNMSLESIEW
jgi:hypothetical protein